MFPSAVGWPLGFSKRAEAAEGWRRSRQEPGRGGAFWCSQWDPPQDLLVDGWYKQWVMVDEWLFTKKMGDIKTHQFIWIWYMVLLENYLIYFEKKHLVLRSLRFLPRFQPNFSGKGTHLTWRETFKKNPRIFQPSLDPSDWQAQTLAKKLSDTSGFPYGRPSEVFLCDSRESVDIQMGISWVIGVPSGKHTKNDGKSPFLMGKLTIKGHFP